MQCSLVLQARAPQRTKGRDRTAALGPGETVQEGVRPLLLTLFQLGVLQGRRPNVKQVAFLRTSSLLWVVPPGFPLETLSLGLEAGPAELEVVIESRPQAMVC